MITSFFKPKSKPGCKRPRNVDGDNASGVLDHGVTCANKKQLSTTTTSDADGISLPRHTSTTSSNNSKSKPLSVEAAALLSFLHAHAEYDNANTDSWRKALIQYFATTNFTSLAKFVAIER